MCKTQWLHLTPLIPLRFKKNYHLKLQIIFDFHLFPQPKSLLKCRKYKKQIFVFNNIRQTQKLEMLVASCFCLNFVETLLKF